MDKPLSGCVQQHSSSGPQHILKVIHERSKVWVERVHTELHFGLVFMVIGTKKKKKKKEEEEEFSPLAKMNISKLLSLA